MPRTTARADSCRLVLASGSPRRLDLLAQIGLVPDRVIATEIDETPRAGELPAQLASRLARAKAEEAVAGAGVPGAKTYLLGADTVVAVGRRVLPKPETEAEARACLDLVSGRAHRVYTAVALATPSGRLRERLVETRVRFKRLAHQEVEAYIASAEWRGKAGGYAIQGRAAAFVLAIIGSYSSVVGLPLYETAALLDGEGFPVRRNWVSQP